MFINSSFINFKKDNFYSNLTGINQNDVFKSNYNQNNELEISRKNSYTKKNNDIYIIKNIFEESKNSNDEKESFNIDSFYYLDKIHKKNEIKEMKEIQIKNDKKCLGRKKKRNSTEMGTHNKFSDDNMRRKCKHIVLYNIMDFINYKISENYKDIGQGIFLKKLLMLSHEQKSNVNIDYDKKFLEKKIGQIFSENISTRYTSFPKDHNKNLINNLINEKDDNIRIYFNNLFNLTFFQCLKHFRGSELINELNGLIGYKEAINEYEKDGDKDYKSCLEHYINHFETIINNKKSRHKKVGNIKEE